MTKLIATGTLARTSRDRIQMRFPLTILATVPNDTSPAAAAAYRTVLHIARAANAKKGHVTFGT